MTVAAEAASVALKFNKEQEKRLGFGQPPVPSTTRYTRRRQENLNDNDNDNSLAQPNEQEQQDLKSG